MLDSITDAGPEARGKIAVCGSHGGMIAASLASQAGLRAVVLNDAGVGLNQAGLRGVIALDRVAMAAATVSCASARIGSAEDAMSNGVLSAVNATAASLGLRIGQSVTKALPLLGGAPGPEAVLPASNEARFEVEVVAGAPPVICADSASLITANDEGRIIVTGSHGGLIGNDPKRACKARAAFVAFNDAGGGKDNVGQGRLAPLQDQGIAAVVLDAMSCEIGDAWSSLESGRIAGANQRAFDLGIRTGDGLKSALSRVFSTPNVSR